MSRNALMLAQQALKRAQIETEPRLKGIWLEIAQSWTTRADALNPELSSEPKSPGQRKAK
jgi:hypothetical protein